MNNEHPGGGECRSPSPPRALPRPPPWVSPAPLSAPARCRSGPRRSRGSAPVGHPSRLPLRRSACSRLTRYARAWQSASRLPRSPVAPPRFAAPAARCGLPLPPLRGRCRFRSARAGPRRGAAQSAGGLIGCGRAGGLAPALALSRRSTRRRVALGGPADARPTGIHAARLSAPAYPHATPRTACRPERRAW